MSCTIYKVELKIIPLKNKKIELINMKENKNAKGKQ